LAVDDVRHHGDDDTTRGAGTGLSVARGFIEAMGSAAVATEPRGSGLTVEVDLAAPGTDSR